VVYTLIMEDGIQIYNSAYFKLRLKLNSYPGPC
jgi:hypothetical protein